MSKLRDLVDQLESLEATIKRLKMIRQAQPGTELTIQYGKDPDVVKIPGNCEGVVTEKIYLMLIEEIDELKSEIQEHLYPTIVVENIH
jgi:hypothetical protein